MIDCSDGRKDGGALTTPAFGQHSDEEERLVINTDWLM